MSFFPKKRGAAGLWITRFEFTCRSFVEVSRSSPPGRQSSLSTLWIMSLVILMLEQCVRSLIWLKRIWEDLLSSAWNVRSSIHMASREYGRDDTTTVPVRNNSTCGYERPGVSTTYHPKAFQQVLLPMWMRCCGWASRGRRLKPRVLRSNA